MPIFGKSRELKDIEREVKFKQGVSKVRAYIERSRQAQKSLWELGKRSLTLGDRRQFEQVARAYLRTGDVVNRWERYLVTVETVAVQRGQVKATREFMGSMNALSESMMTGARPEEIVKMQVDLEKALAKARTIDETLAAVMDATSDTVFSADGVSEENLKDVESAMLSETEQPQGDSVQDQRIRAGIARIEQEMRKEPK